MKKNSGQKSRATVPLSWVFHLKREHRALQHQIWCQLTRSEFFTMIDLQLGTVNTLIRPAVMAMTKKEIDLRVNLSRRHWDWTGISADSEQSSMGWKVGPSDCGASILRPNLRLGPHKIGIPSSTCQDWRCYTYVKTVYVCILKLKISQCDQKGQTLGMFSEIKAPIQFEFIPEIITEA